jgi:DNA-binding NarL/FixJ family response regulator
MLCTGMAPVRLIRVVVVDDHALHRDGTRQILDAYADLQVVGDAGSGEVALAVINQFHPDVVLMDIRLPGMNGIEVTRRLTRDHPDVRVLMVSSYDEDEYVRGALEAGAAGYLSKTTPGTELVQAVRAVARGTSVLQPGLTARLLMSSRLALG